VKVEIKIGRSKGLKRKKRDAWQWKKYNPKELADNQSTRIKVKDRTGQTKKLPPLPAPDSHTAGTGVPLKDATVCAHCVCCVCLISSKKLDN